MFLCPASTPSSIVQYEHYIQLYSMYDRGLQGHNSGRSASAGTIDARTSITRHLIFNLTRGISSAWDIIKPRIFFFPYNDLVYYILSVMHVPRPMFVGSDSILLYSS